MKTTIKNKTELGAAAIDMDGDKLVIIAANGKRGAAFSRSACAWNGDFDTTRSKWEDRLRWISKRVAGGDKIVRQLREKYAGHMSTHVLLAGLGKDKIAQVAVVSRQMLDEVQAAYAQTPEGVQEAAARAERKARNDEEKELLRRASEYDRVNNEGGGGYNPYRAPDAYAYMRKQIAAGR